MRVEHRRAQLRFEVLGTLSASFCATETLQLLNFGVSGALLEGALPLPLNAEYQMQLVLEAHVSAVTVRVRRVTTATSDTGPPRFRLAVEFLALSPEAEEVITQLVTVGQVRV